MTKPRIWITNVNGSGDGQKGDPGDSAYQVALNNGFVGTEQQWLDSLVGADGLDGADGAKGDQGDPGPAGADGVNGLDGIDGADALWNFTGAYGIGTAYAIGDVATYEGQTWYRIDSNGGNVGDTPSEGTFWTLIAQKGDTGAQGEPGVSGTTAVLAHDVKAGEALTKGQAVYVSSADGTNMIVSKASNAMESTSSKTMGLITTDLAHNGQGTLITEGLLAGLNTNGANAGDPVWLGTDGNLIYGLLNKPSAPAHLVFIGIVTRANANNGEIFVKPQNGFEVRELHDAVIDSNGSIADNEIFAYDSISGMWKNQTAAEAGLQTRVLDVSDAEIGYLKNVTSDIQTQINEKAALLSPTITMASFASASSIKDPVTISTANGIGGPGYAGLITLENSGAGVTNPKKYFRLNNVGALEIVNSAYSDTIFYLADNGNLSELGTVNGATIGDTGWISVTSFNNNFTGTNVAYRKINNVVYLRGRLSGGNANNGAFFLPEGFRPSTIEVVIPTQQYGTANINYTSVGNDGNVVPNASSAWLSSIIFPVG